MKTQSTNKKLEHSPHRFANLSASYTSKLDYIFVDLSVCDNKLNLLIDSGSEVSLLPLAAIKGNELIDTSEKIQLIGITENVVNTVGTIKAKIRINDSIINYKFHVLPRKYPLRGVLGKDFFCEHNAIINYDKKIIELKGTEVQITDFDNNIAKVNLILSSDKANSTETFDTDEIGEQDYEIQQTVVLPARCEKLVKLNTPKFAGTRLVISSQITDGIKLGACLVSCNQGTIIVPIINTNDYSVTLDKVLLTLEKWEEPPKTYESNVNICHKANSEQRSQELFKEININPNLNKEELKSIKKLISENNHLFYLPGDSLIGTKTIKHKIKTSNDQPIMIKPYRLPEAQKSIINEEINDLLSKEIIKPSVSPFNAPLLVVPKKAGPNGERKYRVVVDFRKLNDVTVGDAYPLPQINEILDQLGHARYFSTLDLASGYHQIHMDPADSEKTAFSTTFGHFEFNRLPFGLKGGPATFQRLMNQVLTGLQGVKCFVYLDDIVVYGKNIQDHNTKLQEVFQCLEKHSLRLQPSKCNILLREITYLGHKISENGIKPDETKLECVKNFPVPKTQKQVMSFLGLANYYRKFIKGFSKIAQPINRLLKKNIKFDWSTECQEAFDEIKNYLLNPPILTMPNFNEKFIITTDASDKAIGAILSQGIVGEDLPISYASRSLNKAEQNYSTSEKELLAIVWATKNFRPYVLGREFVIITDHKPLQWVFNSKDMSSRLTRWRLKLEEYDYKIIYKAGVQNTNADALSRIPYEAFVLTRSQARNEADKTDEGQKDENHSLQSPSNITTLTEPSEIETVLKEFHDSPLGGHQGYKRTIHKLKQYYSWENMNKTVEEYIKNCKQCQTHKICRVPRMPMTITTTSKKSFEKIFLDIVGPLTETYSGNKYILTMQDDLTKYSRAIAIPNQTANVVAREFATNFICVFGCPESILTDQGSNFMSQVFKDMCKDLKIKKLNTSSYHPQTNGALERSHQTLANYLRIYTEKDQLNWDIYLPYASFMYNSTPHSSSNFTPYELVFGFQPNLPSSIKRKPQPLYNYDDYSKELKNKLQESWNLANDNIKQSKITSKTQYDRSAMQRTFKITDKVLYRNQTREGKLDQLWDGPYPIEKIDSDVNTTIKIKNKLKTVHNNDLKLYNEITD